MYSKPLPPEWGRKEARSAAGAEGTNQARTLLSFGVLLERRTLVAALLSSTFLLSGCGDDRANLDPGGNGSPSPNVDPPRCGTPNEGCPCDSPGEIVECGDVKHRSGDYVSCSIGERACTESGLWGACVGDQVATRHVPGTGLSIQGLGASASCTAQNPCDPYCNHFVDTPLGVNVGPDLTAGDAGVAITGTAEGTGTGCSSLVVSPTPQTLNVTNFNTPGTLNFGAQLYPLDCYPAATPALWSIDRYDIAQISATGQLRVVTPIAGDINVQAFAGSLTAGGIARVRVNVVDVSSAPNNVTAETFNAATNTADSGLTILYPYRDTVFPLGLQPPLIQWRSTTAASAVKVSLRYPATGAAIFNWSAIMPENQTFPTGIADKRAIIPPAVWSAFEQTAKGQEASFVLQRRIGTALRVEVVTRIRFATAQLKGKVYYNSYGTNLVRNYEPTHNNGRFGAATLAIAPNTGGTPQLVAGYDSGPSNSSGCRVCHALSSNGNVLLTQRFTPNNKTTSRYDLVTGVETLLGAATGDGRFAWPALSPDGTYLFSNSGPSNFDGTNASLTSRLFSASTGSELTGVNMPTTLKAATPKFSHDATKLAFNFYAGSASPLTTTGVTSGDQRSLSMMDFSYNAVLARGTFSNFRTIYTPAAGQAAVWPTFLPPSENGLVFERETVGNGRDFAGTRSRCDDSSKTNVCHNDGVKAELWWARASGTPTPVALQNANGIDPATSTMYLPTGDNAHNNDAVLNYEPTTLPVTAGGYSWIMFTSRRLYGNVATINPYWSDPRFRDISVQPTPKKLWVAAIAQNPRSGTDPSFPAFYLPGQELLAGNSLAYWVLDACKSPGPPLTAANVCETDQDCCGAPATSTCRLDSPLSSPPVRHCVSRTPAVCAADGAACTTDLDCCGIAGGSRCANGACQQPPSIIVYDGGVFTRDYQAACPNGSRAVWRFFSWQSHTPGNSRIFFTAQTGDNASSLGAAVPIGTAAAPPEQTVTWTHAAQTVDAALRAAGQLSKPFLRITLDFRATSDRLATPTLQNWRQVYDCVPSE